MSDREEMAERIAEEMARSRVDEHRGRFPGVTAAWGEGPRTIGEALTTDAMYAARARFNARLAARPCCRSHGTTCPACRKADYEAPRWLVRLRDLLDVLRAWRGAR